MAQYICSTFYNDNAVIEVSLNTEPPSEADDVKRVQHGDEAMEAVKDALIVAKLREVYNPVEPKEYPTTYWTRRKAGQPLNQSTVLATIKRALKEFLDPPNQ